MASQRNAEFSIEERESLTSKFQDKLKEYINGLKNEDGRVDFWGLFVTSQGMDNANITAQMAKNYEWAQETVQEFESMVPFVGSMNRIEVRILHAMAETAFPYWFAREYILDSSRELECNKDSPLNCLPPTALAWIAAWYQISCLIALTFTTLLIAAWLGRSKSSSKHSVTFVLACLLVDLISCASLFIPVLGNAMDLVWAPLAGVLVGVMFKSWKIGLAYCIKEAFIVTDLVPMATMLALG